MAINFDGLPKEKPEGMGTSSVPEPGFHKVKITKAEVTKSKAGNKYIKMFLKTEEGPMVFDNIFDSDAPALQYKLARLITACKLPLTGELTLEDLAKVLVNRDIVADIKIVENTWNGETKPKAEVDLFSNDIFYPADEYSKLVDITDISGENTGTTEPTEY